MGYFFYPLCTSPLLFLAMINAIYIFIFFYGGGEGGKGGRRGRGGKGEGGRDTEKKYYLTMFTGLQEHIEYVT